MTELDPKQILKTISEIDAQTESLYDLLPEDILLSAPYQVDRNVTIIEMFPKLATNLGRTTRGFLIGIAKIGGR